MQHGMIRRVCAVLFAVAVAVTALAVEPVAAAPSAPAVAQQRQCDDYIPSDLAINVTSAAPGQTVTITGLAYPGDTVTIRIAQFGGPPNVLATAIADSNGFFSANITIPANYPEGTYNITVSSPNCSGVGVITIVVRFPGGRCTDRVTITAQRGATVDWTLLGVLDTTKPLTVTLVPVAGGPSVVVYTGPYPASGEVQFVVPASLGNGRYRIVESGTGMNGKPLSARCGRLRVRGGGGGGTTTTTTSTSTTTPGGSTTTTPGGSTTTTTPGGTCESYSFDPTVKLIDFDGYNPKVEFSPTVPAVLPAGAWNITNASSWDSYPSRTGVYQGSEVWEIEFLDAAGNVLARSGPTGDVPDYVDPGQWSGPLGVVNLPAGVAKVRAHHLPDLYPDGPDSVANSVFPVGFSICGGSGGGTTTTQPGTTTTTQPGTTTTAPGSTTTSTTTSTVPGGGGGGSTTTSTTAPSSTTSTSTPGGNVVATTTTTAPVAVANNQVERIGSSSPTQVAGNSTSRSSGSGATGLATTGSTVRPMILLGAILIAAGALFALGARRRRD
mgnify:CR=1 FL=1